MTADNIAILKNDRLRFSMTLRLGFSMHLVNRLYADLKTVSKDRKVID